MRTDKGPLHIRADVVRSCFAEPSQPPDVLGLLRTPVGRCETVDPKHVTCNSSLGTWEGVSSNTAISLRMVRRTLGALHLLDGKAVQSGRFARVVVAVEMAKPNGPRETTLYATMQQAVQSTLSGGDGSVRAVPGDDPDATLHITVALHNLVIGDLVQGSSNEKTTYEDHKETRENPDKPKAKAAVAAAESAVQQAIMDFQNRQAQARQAQQTCLSGCFGQYAAICQAGCNVGGAILTMVVDSDPAVTQAREALNQARANEAATPQTIEVPIMLPWPYKKTTYQRSVSVALDVDANFLSGAKHWSKPLSTSVDDYDVTSDARHNVPGHAVNRDIIDKPDSLLPLIGRLIAGELAKRVRAGVNQEREERAVKAFETSGHEATRPENRSVDAAAFDIAGARILQAVQHGGASLGAQAPFAIPVELVPPSCLLVVAAAEDPEDHLTLSTTTGSHADLQGASAAALEICPGEDQGGAAPVVQLSASKPGQARWGIYSMAPGK